MLGQRQVEALPPDAHQVGDVARPDPRAGNLNRVGALARADCDQLREVLRRGVLDLGQFDPALVGEGGGVHQIDLLLGMAAEGAGDDRDAEHARVVLGQSAAELGLDPVDHAVGETLRQRSEVLAERDERRNGLVTSQPKRRAIHVIADNLSTHRTQAVRTFLIAHPHVRIHFTPTYSSWLNQIELWFSKIERDLLARGIFTSVADLARKIRRYIRHYNTQAKPIRWNYRNPAHRISSTSASTVH